MRQCRKTDLLRQSNKLLGVSCPWKMYFKTRRPVYIVVYGESYHEGTRKIWFLKQESHAEEASVQRPDLFLLSAVSTSWAGAGPLSLLPEERRSWVRGAHPVLRWTRGSVCWGVFPEPSRHILEGSFLLPRAERQRCKVTLSCYFTHCLVEHAGVCMQGMGLCESFSLRCVCWTFPKSKSTV